MRYALINTQNELQRVQDFADAPPTLPESKGLRWLEYLDTPQPAFDPITQRLESAPVVDSKYTTAWQIVALDADAIAANRANAAEALQRAIVVAVQQRLDTFAQSHNYDSTDSISKYQNISDGEIAALPTEDQPMVLKFRTECRYLAVKIAQTWAVLYAGLAEVQAGTRPMPTSFADIEQLLPVLEWPV